MSEIEPRPAPKGEIEPRHIPSVVFALPIEEARSLVTEAIRGTSLTSFQGRYFAGSWLFDLQMRLSPVDDSHTRIELLATGTTKAFDTLFFVHRRGAIDRFFVAIQDELDRREKWRPTPIAPEAEQ